MATSSALHLLEFLQYVGKLKNIKRTGWVLRNVPDPETVSGHMYRMGIMTMLLPDNSGLDLNKCLKMALVHDIGECIVGDITPFCGVSTEDKHRMEAEAMDTLSKLAGEMGPTLTAYYNEYAKQATSEAKFVKELDRLDMILQAYEYEVKENTPGAMQEFFDSTKDKFQHPWVKEIIKKLHEKRKNHVKTYVLN